jgi:hypothetical protein
MKRLARLKYYQYISFLISGNTRVFAMQNARVALFLCCWLTALPLFAQIPESASASSQPVVQALSAEDTLPVMFTQAFAPEKRLVTNDTLPDLVFRLYDPARKGALDDGHLGNLGTAARPLWFSPLSRIGFESGFRAFQLYELTPNDLQFYRHARTYSHAYFSRGRSQRDAESWLKLSRTFSGGLNFSLQFKTINNLGEYRFQRTKHSSLAAGIWWPVRKNYEVFLIYATNTFQQQDNGGITTPAFFDSTSFTGMISVPVLLDGDNSKTKNSKRDLQLSQYYTFGKTANRLFRAEHTLNYRTEIWKYSDINTPGSDQTIDTGFYGGLLTDLRGLRHYVKINRIDNSFFLNTLPSNAERTANGNRFAAGIKHSAIWVEQEPLSDSLFSNLFLTGRFTFEPSKRLSLIANGDLGLLPQNGYRVNAALKIDLGKAGILEGRLLNQLHPPDLVQSQVYSTSRKVYQYNFKLVFENSLSATYSLPKLGFSANGALHLINNYIYFGANSLPVQIGSPIQVGQLMVRQNFKFGIFRSENTVGLQQINDENLLRLPNWFTKNSLYISRHYFKKALFATYGADFRMNSAFQPDGYQPFTGQFHLQSATYTQAPFPWIDVFMAVKIEKFRFFLRFENIATIWNPAENLYLTENHPQTQFTFRLGFSWRFLDSNTETANNQGSGSGGGSPTGGGFGRGNNF